MKIIITKDQGKLGKVGDVLEVKDGFARNFLFPAKSAIVYTESNLVNLNKFIPKKSKKNNKNKTSKRNKKNKS